MEFSAVKINATDSATAIFQIKGQQKLWSYTVCGSDSYYVDGYCYTCSSKKTFTVEVQERKCQKCSATRHFSTRRDYDVSKIFYERFCEDLDPNDSVHRIDRIGSGRLKPDSEGRHYPYQPKDEYHPASKAKRHNSHDFGYYSCTGGSDQCFFLDWIANLSAIDYAWIAFAVLLVAGYITLKILGIPITPITWIK